MRIVKCDECGQQMSPQGLWRHKKMHEREVGRTKKPPATALVPAMQPPQQAKILDVQSGLANLSAQIDNRIATLLGEKAKLNEINAELAALEDWKAEIKRLLDIPVQRSSKAGD